MSNLVYIAASMDGFIADKDGGVAWLDEIANPEGLDFGWGSLMARVDAMVMGRNSFDTVCGFDCPWPYEKPVFVLSNSMTRPPKGYEDKIQLVRGPLREVFAELNGRGFKTLYIDGGLTIQNALAEDLIDEITITRFPILLGGGVPLFGALRRPLKWTHEETTVYLNELVMSRYRRGR